MFELQQLAADLAEEEVFEGLQSLVGKLKVDQLELELLLLLLRAVVACGHLAAHPYHLVVLEVLEVEGASLHQAVLAGILS